MKTERTIRKHEKELRDFIDSVPRPKTKQEIIEQRMAYLVETSLRWTRIKTVGWESRLIDVETNADILIKELANLG